MTVKDVMENIISSFKRSCDLLNESPCIWYEHRNRWMSISWRKFHDLVFGAAAGWQKLGINEGKRVAIFGGTSWEWTLADMSLLTAGAVTVPIYHTLPSFAAKKILEDSGVETAVGDRMLWEQKGNQKIEFFSWHLEGEKCVGDIYKEGKDDKSDLIKRAVQYPLDNIATIVYTSGTTGDPKGAIITHKNIAAEVFAVRQVFLFPHEYVGIACLPLSHVLGRMMQFYQLSHGCQTAYVPDLTKLPSAYKAVRPHYFCAVPRLLEKIEDGVNAEIKKRPFFEKQIFEWAKNIGDEIVNCKQWHKKAPLMLRLKYFIAYAAIFRKIRKALGGRIRSIICGGAPLNASLAKLLHASKIEVLEGYGLTETFAAVTVNRLDDFRLGTVGKAVAGVDIKFADDGELLIKGGVVTQGYWKKEEETKALFTSDGWFRSGDIGEYTRDGFVRLTGRKKDIIITSGGKNVSPTPIEDKLKEIPFITQAVLYGDGRKFLSAIVVVDPLRLKEEAEKLGKKLSDNIENCRTAYSIISSEIEKKNETFASFERIKKFIIITQPFSIEGGELTPKLSVRRSIIAERYKDRLDELYQ